MTRTNQDEGSWACPDSLRLEDPRGCMVSREDGHHLSLPLTCACETCFGAPVDRASNLCEELPKESLIWILGNKLLCSPVAVVKRYRQVSGGSDDVGRGVRGGPQELSAT